MDLLCYARRRFDVLIHPPYDDVGKAWAAALGIDAVAASATSDLDVEEDEDPDLRSCRTQRHGVRL